MYMWIDLGTWNIVLPNNLKKTCARAVWLWKADYRKPRKRHSDHYATETLPSRNFAFSLSLCLGCKGLGLAWLAAAKNQFFTLWKIDFSTVLLWNSEKQGFAKKNFSSSKKSFFLALLIWNSEKQGFAKKQFFRLLKNVFSTLLIWNSEKPGFALKQFFRL